MAVPAFLVGIAKMPKSVFAKSLGVKPKVSASEIVRSGIGVITQAVSPALSTYVKAITSGVRPAINRKNNPYTKRRRRYDRWTAAR